MFNKVKITLVKDPFEITNKQKEFALQIYLEYDAMEIASLELTGERMKLSKKENQEKDIMAKINSVGASLVWAKSGGHWDNDSTNAIAYLHSLGFKTNEDIQRYLDDRILP
jgi:hypothetical protein